MKIYSVRDPEFASFGKLHSSFDTELLCSKLLEFAQPGKGTVYETSISELEACEEVFNALRERIFGGIGIQLGMCRGYNTRLNCLEYHRCSEVLIGAHDCILLLAKIEEISDGVINTDKVKAFRMPKGVPVEIYATTLHYSPCHVEDETGFRVAVALPLGTNEAKPEFDATDEEDKMLMGCNKWLLAHRESEEASAGAYIGLVGTNIDIKKI